MADTVKLAREVEQIADGVPTTDGDGVKLIRAFTRKLRRLDPFLLLDEFRSENPGDYIAGFPDPPRLRDGHLLARESHAHRDSRAAKVNCVPGACNG